MQTADAIARYLIREFAARGNPISHLKLQKLLYYSQAWHLGLFGKPLFADPIQAWVHGPVIPGVFQSYRRYRWSAIPKALDPKIPARIAKHLNEVADAYGSLSAAQLEKLSHGEEPWERARGSLDPTTPSNAVISETSMRDYFRKLRVDE